jgi:LacI family transcriptional regulator
MTALSINLSDLILIYLNKYRAFIDLCLYLSHSGDQRTQFKNDFMKTTITDVAKLADVSMKTVSRVLNNEPNVAKKTREKVLRAAKELRYSPNLAAKGLASSKSYLIALLYDNPSPNYIANIQKGAIKACRDNNYYLVIEPLSMTNANAGDEVEKLLERLPVDGIILTPPLCDDKDVLGILRSLKIPYVPVAPTIEINGVSSVKMDDVQASFEMTEYLIKSGHKKIGFIKGHIEHSATALRYKGYKLAMEKFNLKIDENFIVNGDFSFKSGVEAAENLLGLKEPPTAIFASNDDMAAGVVSVASRLGLEVPTKLSVGGFDDTPLAQILFPQLTTVKQPIYEMGKMAANLLINPPTRDDLLPSYHLDHKLIIRKSTDNQNILDN